MFSKYRSLTTSHLNNRIIGQRQAKSAAVAGLFTASLLFSACVSFGTTRLTDAPGGGDAASSQGMRMTTEHMEEAESAESAMADESAADASVDFIAVASDSDSGQTVVAVAVEPAQANQLALQSRATASPQPTSQAGTSVDMLKPTEPADMFFDDYGVNPFVDSAVDNLSTFAMDVDTGSYTIMRNYIRDGLLPPQDAVRVEEFVNYFDYDYTMPSIDDIFAIDIDMAQAPFADLLAEEATSATPDIRTVRVGIQGYEIPAELRDDVALTFVIDVSGSMEQENRLTLAKRAMNMLVEELRPSDSVAIVVYGSAARVVLQPTSATDENKNDIIAAIHRLHTEGSTNAEAGLRLGYDSAWRHLNPQANNRVILISDGVANVGATGPDSIWAQIEQYAERGITMTSVGVGMGNYNDVLMEQLANMGDGTYAYVDTIDEARRIFVDELTGTLQTIAKDAKVQVEFNQALVSAYRLIGYENRDVADDDFRDDSVDAGEIGAGHSVTALYEVVLHEEQSLLEAAPNEDDEALLTVSLRWLNPKTGESSEIAESAGLADYTAAFYENTADFQLAVVVAEYAEILRASHWTAEDEVSAELVDEIYRIGSLLDADEKVDEFISLVERASQIAIGG